MFFRTQPMDAQRFDPSLSLSSRLNSRSSSPDLDSFLFRAENPLDSQRYNPSLKSPRNSPKIRSQPLPLSIADQTPRPGSPTASLDETAIETAVPSESTTAFSSPRISCRKTSIETLDLNFKNEELHSEVVSLDTQPHYGPVEEIAAIFEEVSDATCKIIRPIPVSPIFSIFSRPSTPVAPRRSPPPSPSISPFRLLDCCGSSSNFEDDVDYFQSARQKQQSGQLEAKIEVVQTHEVALENRWRQTVYSIMQDQEQAMQYLREKTAVC